MYWVRALYHWFSYSSVISSRLYWSSGGWKDPVSSSVKTYPESFKKLVRISLAVQDRTLVQYFPGTACQSCSHLSAVLPVSESGEDFMSLPDFQHSHPCVPELCSVFLHVPSALRCWLCSIPFVSFHNGVPGFLFSISSPSTSRDFLRHICQGMFLPCSPWTPASLSTGFLFLESSLCLCFFTVCRVTGLTAWIQNKLLHPAWWGSTSPSPLSLLPP